MSGRKTSAKVYYTLKLEKPGAGWIEVELYPSERAADLSAYQAGGCAPVTPAERVAGGKELIAHAMQFIHDLGYSLGRDFPSQHLADWAGKELWERSGGIGDRIRAMMKAQSLSATELAARAGLSRQSLHKILSGSVPSWPTVQKLAEGLGVPTDAFRQG